MAVATKYIKFMRNFLAGRDYQSRIALRYARDQQPRSVPPANLPGGVAHQISNNYYLTRDGRRLVTTPEIVYSQVKRLPAQAASSTSSSVPVKKPSRLTPGTPYEWNISEDQPYLP